MHTSARTRVLSNRLLLLLLSTLALIGSAADSESTLSTNRWRWEQMDHGPFFTSNLEGPRPALKNITVRLGKDDAAAVSFDTMTLRWNAAWSGGFLHLPKGRDGMEGVPSPWGDILFGTSSGPGWAHQGSLVDPRVGAEKQSPLPRSWAHWKGLFLHDSRVVLNYTVGTIEMLETVDYSAPPGGQMFTRTLQADQAIKNETLLLADGIVSRGKSEPNRWWSLDASPLPTLQVQLTSGSSSFLESTNGRLLLHLRNERARQPIRIAFFSGTSNPPSLEKPISDLRALTHGGSPRWGSPIVTQGKLATSGGDGPYVTDTITPPDNNPYHSWLRFSGLDFFKDSTRAALCSVSGDVWLVSGIDRDLKNVQWKRFATGLFQPLGLKIVDDQVFVLCRDALYQLRDLNSDGEADHYRSYNNDVSITSHYHEFCLGLETDRSGNFYFNKGGNLGDATIPHHGCLLRISADGSKLDIVATGLRAPNGIGIGPNNEITTSDNEGNWVPACRVNLTHPGGFYGHVFTSHRPSPPSTFDGPLFWLPKNVDNSSGGQVWVTSDRWGPFQGDLLHTAYGTCSLFKAFYETIDGFEQGGVIRFPLKFDSGIMRSRFNPGDGQLYTCGLVIWQSNGARQGAFHRVRFTGKTVYSAREVRVKSKGLEITFTQPLDTASAQDVQNYGVERWNYRWTKEYGSPEYSVLNPEKKGHDTMVIKSSNLSPDGYRVFLELEDLRPVMQQKVKFSIKSRDGSDIDQEIFHTIHRVPQ